MSDVQIVVWLAGGCFRLVVYSEGITRRMSGAVVL
jgi:hypothetical protein